MLAQNFINKDELAYYNSHFCKYIETQVQYHNRIKEILEQYVCKLIRMTVAGSPVDELLKQLNYIYIKCGFNSSRDIRVIKVIRIL